MRQSLWVLVQHKGVQVVKTLFTPFLAGTMSSLSFLIPFLARQAATSLLDRRLVFSLVGAGSSDLLLLALSENVLDPLYTLVNRHLRGLDGQH